MSGPSPERKQQVLAAVRQAPALTRRQWLRRVAGVPVLALLLLTPLVGLHGIPDLQARPRAYLIALLGSVVGLCVAATWALWGALRSPLGPGRVPRLLVTRLGVPLLFVAALLANGLAPETLHGPAPHLAKHLFCPLALLASGGLVAWAALRALRGTDPVRPGNTAGLIGTWAAALALLAVSLQCGTLDPVHVLGAHLVPVVVLAALARRFGRKLVAP